MQHFPSSHLLAMPVGTCDCHAAQHGLEPRLSPSHRVNFTLKAVSVIQAIKDWQLTQRSIEANVAHTRHKSTHGRLALSNPLYNLHTIALVL